MSATDVRTSISPSSWTQLRRSRLRRLWKGASAVEFAVISPLLVLLTFGSMELGRAVMVQHVLEEAALAGCRIATVDNADKQQVLDVVGTAMQNAGIANYSVNVNPDPPGQANLENPVTVSVTTGYDEASWLGSPWFMEGKQLTGTCVLPIVENDESKAKEKAKVKVKAKSKAKVKAKVKAKAKAKAKVKARYAGS